MWFRVAPDSCPKLSRNAQRWLHTYYYVFQGPGNDYKTAPLTLNEIFYLNTAEPARRGWDTKFGAAKDSFVIRKAMHNA